MKFAIISDVHVKHPGDNAEKLLLSFLRDDFVKECDGIFLIGDIFDLMIGPHSQYFSRFQAFFTELKLIIQNKKHVYYVEGNHDFHLRNLYGKFFEVHSELDQSFFHINKEFRMNMNGKKIHLSHGDDLEIDNLNYKLFKSFVTSMPLTIYANHFMPYFLITKVGEASSQASRKRNNKRYSLESDLNPVKEKFRKSAEIFCKKEHFDIVVCGHSHVKDLYISENKFVYVNNGYAQHTKTYISIEDGNVGFRKL